MEIYTISYKNRSNKLKNSLTKTAKTSIKDIPKVAASNSIKDSLKCDAPVSKPLLTGFDNPKGSTHINPSTTSNKAATARPGDSAFSSGGGGLSIDIQIASLRAKMNSEKDPIKRAILHSQLLALQAKKEEQARQQHNEQLKRLNKFKP